MKKIIILACLTILVFSAHAFSVHAGETKIGYVDLNRALNDSNEGKKAVAALENMVKAKQKLIGEKEEELNNLKKEIVSQTAILNNDALKKKQDEHDELVKAYQRMIQDSKEDIQKKQADFMKGIIIKLRQVIAELGEEEGYTVILEKIESGILYMPDSIDLTDKVIKRFNESSKTDE
jgi:outer membrane protein